MTKEQWKEVDEKLKSIFCYVKLKCDDYTITIALRRLSQFKNGIFVYIDGKIEGKWLMNDCEERRRFYRKVTKSLGMTKKQKELFSKMSKKLKKEIMSDRKYTYYSEYWTSFGALRRQLIKENSNIELIEAVG